MGPRALTQEGTVQALQGLYRAIKHLKHVGTAIDSRPVALIPLEIRRVFEELSAIEPILFPGEFSIEAEEDCLNLRRNGIIIPVPPSVNNLFVNADKGRKKSAKYRAWIQEAGWLVNAQKTIPLSQPLDRAERYQVNIDAYIDRKRDLDNICKPILDLLVSLQLVPDDQFCDRVQLVRADKFFELEKNEVRVHYAAI